MFRTLARAAICSAVLFACAGAGDAATQESREKRAIIVGINDYRGDISDLEGAENDADSIAALLVSRWGFQSDDVTLLRGNEATRSAILAALQALESQTQPGSTIVFYFAGHGDSAAGGYFGSGLPQGTGALVPSDYEMGSNERLIVGRTDLRPIFSELDRSGRELLVIVDSCFSGSTVRGQGETSAGTPRLPSRSVVTGVPSHLQVRRGAADYPYENLVYLAASGEYEPASDIPARFLKFYPTLDGKPHGAFTDALLRALSGQLPGFELTEGIPVDLRQLRNSLANFMQARKYTHTPQMLPPLGTIPRLQLVPEAVGVAEAQRPGITQELQKVRPSPALSVKSPPGPLEAVCATVRCSARDWDIRLEMADSNQVLLYSSSGDLLGRSPLSQIERRLAMLSRVRVLESALLKRADRRLRAELASLETGYTLRQGDELSVAVESTVPGRIVLLVADSDGGVSILYPATAEEADALHPSTSLRIDQIKVVPPFGRDLLFAFSIDPDRQRLPSQWVGGSFGISDDEQPEVLSWIQSLIDAGSPGTTFSVHTSP